MSVCTFIAANCPMDEVDRRKNIRYWLMSMKERFTTVMPTIISICTSSGKYLIIRIKSMAFALNGLTRGGNKSNPVGRGRWLLSVRNLDIKD